MESSDFHLGIYLVPIEADGNKFTWPHPKKNGETRIMDCRAALEVCSIPGFILQNPKEFEVDVISLKAKLFFQDDRQQRMHECP